MKSKLGKLGLLAIIEKVHILHEFLSHDLQSKSHDLFLSMLWARFDIDNLHRDKLKKHKESFSWCN